MKKNNHTKLVVPISGKNIDEISSLAVMAKDNGADLIEIRLDTCFLLGANLDEVVKFIPNSPLPIIATNRAKIENGDWNKSDKERLEWLLKADDAGASMIDVELRFALDLPRRPKAKLILSYHDFNGMGENLAEKVKQAEELNADIIKFAVTPKDADDCNIIKEFYGKTEKPLVAIGMGEYGLPTRVLAGCFESPFTFCSLETGSESAPGQITLSDMVNLYRVKEQNKNTKIYGILGKPVSHSMSPLIHNKAFIEKQLNAVYAHFLADNPVKFFKACKSWIDGLSITIPHKVDLLEEMDELEELAKNIGAMNTVYKKDGKFIGANTDAYAAVDAVKEVGEVKNKKVLIFGAGGVSRAIAFAFQKEKAEVIIANRTVEKAEVLANEIGCGFTTLKDVKDDYDILINCTSVGMNSDKTIWTTQHKKDSIVFDTVYTPMETKLLSDAKESGAKIAYGVSMFYLQAIGQFNRWFSDAPVELMKKTVLEKF